MSNTEQYYVNGRIKESKDLTKAEKRDVAYLEGLVQEYRDNFTGAPEYAERCHKLTVILANNKLITGERDQMTVEQKFQVASSLLTKLKKHYDASKSATREVFLVVDKHNKLGQLIKSQRSVQETIHHYLAMALKSEGGPMLEPHEIKNYGDIWFNYSDPVEFEVFGGFSDDKWCLGRCLYKPAEHAGEMPTWEKFLGRLNDPAGFAAWIYGVASKRYKGRQVMWFHGERGEDGKTFIMKLIAKKLFPNVTQMLTNAALADGARFTAAEFENKSLAYWDDSNNQMALFSEFIKQVSGGESGSMSRIEHKGVGAYSGQLETRLCITSNYAPRVSSDNFITSRLLYIHIDPLDEPVDPTIGERFESELPQFLRFAKACYEKLCADNYSLQQPDSVKEVIGSFLTENEQQAQAIFDEYFELTDETGDPESFVTTAEVVSILKREDITENRKQGDWYTWLQKQYRRSRRKVYINGQQVKVVVGMCLKGSHDPEISRVWNR